MPSLDFLEAALQKRKALGLLRTIPEPVSPDKIDFISNDYLGLAKRSLQEVFLDFPDHGGLPLGSTGSRLVSGQHPWIENLEQSCAQFFEGETALFFPNGYAANLALVSCIASRNDTFIYDERIHASLKDACRLSMAHAYSFRHNDVESLGKKLDKASGRKFVLIESIYSMDGDLAPLEAIVEMCARFGAQLIIDEAHATATFGPQGKGLAISSGLSKYMLARVYTFGKALGAAGAVLIIDHVLKEYLINFAHPFIYSTSPSPVQAFICQQQLDFFKQNPQRLQSLHGIVGGWTKNENFGGCFQLSKNSNSPIQFIKGPDSKAIKDLSFWLNEQGFAQKAMLPPTVPKGSERIRICLHATQTLNQIQAIQEAVKDFQNIFQADACD